MTRFFALAFSAALLASASAMAADDSYVITLKDAAFSPNPITVPANKKITLTVKNDTNAPAEFESSSLKREKVVQPGTDIQVLLDPLKPGTYGYVNDFNESTKGTIVAK